MKTKRIIYFDLLKILACFGVVFIHVISEFWYQLSPNSSNFVTLTIFDSLFRFAVPIYFMVSGALFLNEKKEITIKMILTKYVPRILLIYIVWNVVYILGTNIFLFHFSFNWKMVLEALKSTILGNGIYHLTFLTTLLGFYLCIPILRTLTKKEHKKIIEYALIILFIFTGLSDFTLPFFGITMKYDILFNGFTLYFLLGYYLNTFSLNKKQTLIVYSLGVIGLIITAFGTIIYSNKLGYPSEYLFNYLTPNVIFMSSAIFLLFKNQQEIKSSKILKSINFFYRCYFGIYLIHGIVIGIMERLNFFGLNLPFPLLIIFGTVVCFIISLIITYIISKIPILKKLIVLN